MSDDHGGEQHERFLAYLHRIQDEDLTLGVAMTDGKGDRSKRPGDQQNIDSYVHITERRAEGIVISGAKAIVTGGPYMHELLVMPCRTMRNEDADFAVCCAVPIDARGLTIISRPAGRPGEADAKFSSKYGQSVAVCHFDQCWCPGIRYSSLESTTIPSTWSRLTPIITATVVLARGQALVIT